MTDTFLDKAYGLETQADTQKLYTDWAASYDAEVGNNGYATPKRCAEALREAVQNGQTPVLDYGCGTGLSGLALRAAGFEVIDGMDPNADMLAGAAEKGLYRELSVLDLEDPSPIETDSYSAIAAIGVIGTGAAPVDTLDLLIAALGAGGKLVFSYNDHTLEAPEFTDRLDRHINAGTVKLAFKEYGPHLPGQNINSNVYVIERL